MDRVTGAAVSVQQICSSASTRAGLSVALPSSAWSFGAGAPFRGGFRTGEALALPLGKELTGKAVLFCVLAARSKSQERLSGKGASLVCWSTCLVFKPPDNSLPEAVAGRNLSRSDLLILPARPLPMLPGMPRQRTSSSSLEKTSEAPSEPEL